MITLTQTARDKIVEFVDEADDECIGIRVLAAKVGRHTFRYQMQLTRDQDAIDGDTQVDFDGFCVVLDVQTAELMAARPSTTSASRPARVSRSTTRRRTRIGKTRCTRGSSR